MLIPAFETQYSPRFTEATVAEMEEILMIQPVNAVSSFLLFDHPVGSLLRKKISSF